LQPPLWRGLPQAIGHALERPGPALVHVVAATHELPLPPKIELAHVKGFSLYMLRAVLKGQGNEIIERAKTNLR
jgi:pyruvate dehydrogenase (quinone)